MNILLADSLQANVDAVVHIWDKLDTSDITTDLLSSMQSNLSPLGDTSTIVGT